MQQLTVSLNLPRDLLGVLDVPETNLSNRLRELIALELFREGLISSGKGGELVGKTKWDFIQLLAKHNIPYFNETPEELMAGVASLEKLVGDNQK